MTMTETRDIPAWIAALAVGDTVVLHEGRLSGHGDITARVTRLTPTQIVIASPYRSGVEIRFRRADGRAVEKHDRWSARPCILEATVEHVAAIQEAARRTKLTEAIRQTSWQKQSTAVLEAVAALLSPPPGDRPGGGGVGERR